MVVFRHILNTSYRKGILPYIDKLFDDRVLWGTGLGCRESIKYVLRALKSQCLTMIVGTPRLLARATLRITCELI